jgi:hypothetical protein
LQIANDISGLGCTKRRSVALMNQIMITGTEVVTRAKWDLLQITGGVLADEAMRLLGK